MATNSRNLRSQGWFAQPTYESLTHRAAELTLAVKVIPSLRKGMLCMADRFFPSYELWRMAAKTGADLLWRTARALTNESVRAASESARVVSSAR